MARRVNIKKNDGSVNNVPEQLGNIKIKTGLSSSQDITKLYAKTDNTTGSELIWDITPSTQEAGTNAGPIGPCTLQPTCPGPHDEKLHYPLIPGTVDRWDCLRWKGSANTVGLTEWPLNHEWSSEGGPLRDPDVTDIPPFFAPYAKLYDFNGPPPLPPPPGYVVADIETYSVADRVAIYNNGNIEGSANYFFTATSAAGPGSHILFPNRNPAFNTSHGNASNEDIHYSLGGCSCTGGSCAWNDTSGASMVLCDLETPESTRLCGCADNCGGSCFCDGIHPDSQGGGTLPTCANLDDIAANPLFDFIVDTGCIASDEGCGGVCYGRPALLLQGDESPSLVSYSCRYIGRVPNQIVGSSYFNEADFEGFMPDNISGVYDYGLQYKDFAMINDAGCRIADCFPIVTPPCPSTWNIRIFLPFYLNIPSTIYAVGGTDGTLFGLPDGSGSFSYPIPDLFGRYIEIVKESLLSLTDNRYDNCPILKALQNLLVGNTRACGTILSFPWDHNTGATSTNTTFWTTLEYPKQISVGVPSHTHQLVIEYASGNDGAPCTSCLNEANSGSLSRISHIRLYPITDTSGNLLNYETAPYANFFTQLPANFQSLRRQWHPIQGSGSHPGDLFATSTTNFESTFSQVSRQSAVYRDRWNGGNSVTCFNYNGTQVSGVNLTNVLNIVQQAPISTNGLPPMDCQCVNL